MNVSIATTPVMFSKMRCPLREAAQESVGTNAGWLSGAFWYVIDLGSLTLEGDQV